MFAILIDSGTTNSRMRLINTESNLIVDSEKVRIGVRNTAIDGHNGELKIHLRKGLEVLLDRNVLKPSDIEYIVASGMITSKLGLFEVPHIVAPVTVNDFVESSKVIQMEEFHNIPCIFVPGMSNGVMPMDNLIDEIDQFDVMRGEEVESIGLLKQMDLVGKGILVLPGSHTKFVIVDENQALSSCLSTLGGETLLAMQKETILSDSLSDSLIREVDKKFLLKGYEAAKVHGLTRSFYHIRLLQLFTDLNENERANYFVGSVIYDDIQSLRSSLKEMKDIKWIVVGGTNPLKSAFAYLLKEADENWQVIEADDGQVEYSVVIGALEVAKRIEGINVLQNTKTY
ncbi:2-dehydro-3-deoxygalactonokinase [Sporosarcina oncorhynchi]|uniref:2-dehydro-3-deoxygalactonokinase n=1 Tax=Sporosarcina oncorhynchi TaxID=3056444 RepID=A0ABZ0L8X4_9BACL|nr:2-dehydro-3-deoxygalactonokinase [Sporosarcina sp. T2O-4]WOV88092.1 2-dehydro-3-deoxygalactonokinase [Sporosarcina sp. T2O-4]